MGRAERWSGIWLAALAVALAAQSQGPSSHSAARSEPHEATMPEKAFRDILDPHTGQHWILFANPANPAGPGRLVVAVQKDQPSFSPGGDIRPPAIRPGDKVVVEEHNAMVDAFLEAVALEPAGIGSRLKVRLKIGNRVVRAIAVAHGRVVLAP